MLFPFQVSDELTVAIGHIWPTSDRILHGKLISESFARVQVDNVIEGCEKMPVLEVTKTVDIKHVGDMLRCFVQWPRDAIEEDPCELQMPIQQNIDQMSFMNMVKHQQLVCITIHTHMRVYTHASLYICMHTYIKSTNQIFVSITIHKY
ncbi:hypothetical protein Hdeb2414_s0394g00884591 [Helianthus debilis subsp. tardiflorus]